MACRTWVTSLMKADYSSRRLVEHDPAHREADVDRVVELRFGWTSDIPRRRSPSGTKKPRLSIRLGRKTWPYGVGSPGVGAMFLTQIQPQGAVGLLSERVLLPKPLHLTPCCALCLP